jgi:hypothetical protein
MSEQQVAQALKVADDAVKGMTLAQDSAKAVINATLEFANYTRDKLDDAIIQVAAGNNKDALFSLAELRIKFDRFIERNKPSAPAEASG